MEELKCISCGGKIIPDKELMIVVCEYCGNQQPLPAEIFEKLKIEQIEKQEQNNKELRKENIKHTAKVAKVLIPSVIAFIILMVVLFALIIPGVRYSKAVELKNETNYIKAADIFYRISNYKDSKLQYNECRYLQANVYICSGQYYEATALYKNLGIYKDSEMLFNKYKFYELKVGDIITFGNYEQDNVLTNGKEAISWRVLAVEDEKALLITDNLLDCMEYAERYKKVTWDISPMRNWLNNNFINTAFSKDEQKRIILSNLKTADNAKYKISGGKDTTDKIFLLSEQELLQYFADKNDRIAKSTEFAKYKGGYRSYAKSYIYFWWLRSPGLDGEDAAFVTSDGNIDYSGMRNCAVRPAIWIKLDTPQ
ncbi:MAG: hypothetical protein GYA50_08115 [Eubacteriaceae bacterium]|nr:hypothetical protein [Eubacteriaceae bacterium]